ncbi:hypothetical protein E2C01_094309 [Portunus trituberculatus]|uniref:Secreted protein n=1 Tax=Portunus trituberculatus TaxID=210409 RepID=A0A5B7JS40_PORTR|nr:hypothetical protein [Portunus trituberculatus]
MVCPPPPPPSALLTLRLMPVSGCLLVGYRCVSPDYTATFALGGGGGGGGCGGEEEKQQWSAGSL